MKTMKYKIIFMTLLVFVTNYAQASFREQLKTTKEKVLTVSSSVKKIAWIPDTILDTLQNLKNTSFEMTRFNQEPGDYSFVQAASNLINSSYVKPDYPLNKLDSVAGYDLPKVDRQIDSNKYFRWQKVELSRASTGAACSNGSDYKFFVNLTPTTNNFVIFFEPGGACFDAESCSAQRVDRDENNQIIFNPSGQFATRQAKGISNPNGVSDEYPSLLRPAIAGKKPDIASIINPAISRINILEDERIKVQNWNYIYLPYCSGDVHIGDAIKHFEFGKDQRFNRVMYFKGIRNVLGVLGWMRSNLPKPAQVYLTGQSAGGAGVDLQRALVRYFLNPSDHLYTLVDSGFNIQEDLSAEQRNIEQYPATHVKKLMREHWMRQTAQDNGSELGKPLSLMKAILPEFNVQNMNNLGELISKQYPNDRISYVVSLNDLTFSGYGYQLNQGFNKAALLDGDLNNRYTDSFNSNKAKYLIENWNKDISRLQNSIDQQANKNIGYYMPSGRRFLFSHVLTAANYDGVVNDDTRTKMIDVIHNLVDRNNPSVLRERQMNQLQSGLTKPLSDTHQLLFRLAPNQFGKF